MNSDISITSNVKKNRKSGVELLKIFGILLVVISHVVQTLGTKFDSFTYNIDITIPTTDLAKLLISILRYSGSLGNSIFFICSAWFLLDSKKTNKQKILRMIGDVWIISVLWLIVFLLTPNIELTPNNILRSFFPIFSNNTWYITSYIIFCFLYPFLNIIIEKCDKKTHFTIAFVLFLTYIVINFIGSFPESSNMTLWISIYFCISFFKLYGSNFCTSKKANIITLLIGILGNLLLIIGTNLIGLNFPTVSVNLVKWIGNSNIFNILIAFSALNLSMQKKFSNKFINYISSLSLLVYIIHENLLFRSKIRPLIWQWIYDNLGYSNILLWLLLYVVILFILSCILAVIYKNTLQKIVYFISDKIYKTLVKIGNFIQEKILKLFSKEE